MKTSARSRLKRWFGRFGLVALFLAAAVLGTAGGVLFAFSGDLPRISALDDYAPSTITRVTGKDNTLVGEFATERRELVTFEDIPHVLFQAITASEDADFPNHSGLNFKRIAVTAVRRALGRQRFGGASTITQQLARKLFLTDEQTPERKLKEALLSVQIEKRYTKREIFTMYCNKMYWGHGAYGVEAASQLYFAKSVRNLTLDEAALIAGLLQGNVRQSPYVDMAAAVRRRNYVLGRMAAEGFITADDALAARKRAIVTFGDPARVKSTAPYFLELIRTELEARYGTKAVYEGGLVVTTGLDPALQRAATRALDDGLRALDKARGFRKPTRNILAEKRSLDTFRHPRWTRDLTPGDVVPALVLGTDGGTIRVRAGRMLGTIGRTGLAWTKRKAEDLVQTGDLIEVRVGKTRTDGVFDAALEQPSAIEGAVVAVDNHTGQVLAMVGGSSFDRSQFNRAVQAKRQVGSLFKPFVYLTAIDGGYTAITALEDVPMTFDAGPGQPPYEPKNYDREFKGTITLRRALELSRNIPAIALMQTLGPPQVIAKARQLGITTPIPEFLSVAIGAAEGTLLEMTSAYAALPNQGVLMAPTVMLDVRDREGNILEQHRPRPQEAIRADTAYIMTELLHGVIQHGTAANADTAALKWPLGGKTGTTDDYTDAWFIGFDPDITIGVWLGYDLKKPIGDRVTGTTAALPIWTTIMKSWVDRRKAEVKEPPTFQRPGNVVVVTTAAGPEYFISGTEPIIK